MPEPYRIAPDPVAESLVPAPLALPAKAVALAPWVAPLIHRGLGVASLGVTYHAALRTRAIDDAVREAVGAGIEQVVLLGAGLDTRAIRLPELRGARVFEVDHPSTQRYKIERLARAAAGASAEEAEQALRVRRVSMDFERDPLADVLPGAGFEADARSLWVWEGVTMYLTREAIERTVEAIASLSSPGSRIAMTYVPPLSGLLAQLDPILKGALRMFGEPMRTLLPPSEVSDILSAEGFAILSDEGTDDWADRYWSFERRERESERARVIERLVIAEMSPPR